MQEMWKLFGWRKGTTRLGWYQGIHTPTNHRNWRTWYGVEIFHSFILFEAITYSNHFKIFSRATIKESILQLISISV